MNMFKVSTMSAYIRAFQRTNSRDHTTHRNKMVQRKWELMKILAVKEVILSFSSQNQAWELEKSMKKPRKLMKCAQKRLDTSQTT